MKLFSLFLVLATLVGIAVGNDSICAVTAEWFYQTLTCPNANEKIARIDFASFGTPSGSCATGYTVGSCNSPNSVSVANACLGQNSCQTYVANYNFGGDPCTTVEKVFAVQATCQTIDTACSSLPEWTTMSLGCPNAAEVITSVDFASFGTPTGSCATGYTVGSCNSPNSYTIANAACLGKNTCDDIPVNYGTFLGDPCVTVEKIFALQVTCKIPL